MTLMKLMALASAKGIFVAAINMQVIPSHPDTLRAKCNPHGVPTNPGRLIINKGIRTSSAKQNRPALTWTGYITGPDCPVHRDFATSETPANKLTANNMKMILAVFGEVFLMTMVLIKGDRQ